MQTPFTLYSNHHIPLCRADKNEKKRVYLIFYSILGFIRCCHFDVVCVSPSFVSPTGSISWKGTLSFDAIHYYYASNTHLIRKRTVHLHGKVWRDDQGNYYRTEQKVDGRMDNKKPPLMKTVFVVRNQVLFCCYVLFKSMVHQPLPGTET